MSFAPHRKSKVYDRSSAILFICFILTPLFASADLYAQADQKPEPDVVVFPNGEKLIGHFESFSKGSAKFKSETLGEVTVDLSKVQELHTSARFAVIRKDVKLARGKVDGQIPRGSISVANKNVEVSSGKGEPTQTVAVGDLNNIIDEASFDQAFRHTGIFDKWNGAIAFGTSIVEATQNSLSFNTTANLIRTIPTEDWLSPSNRTTMDFTDTYGKVTQPGTPEVRTSIYHADAERDEYFSAKFYALGSVAFDHNYSQGLELQQLYGGGIGWSALQKPSQTLDFKGSIDYEKQSFQNPTPSVNLVDSIFSETYSLKFASNILLKEQLSASPAWTNTNAYSAYASVGITLPVHKRFGLSANIIDSFLNDPPAGFKKNSIQFNTGLTYSLH